ncbi:hypothetical protein COI68_30315 [Priestia megaterium]|uniref:hypothetical protein n=1 Tax=Priestia megaterium TaxID=1404 RepID=UPI000BF55492|nr:hypothetical protein [Priestia megaterium]PFI53534.1 hypothetical protein COI68_30315 [Priestia megaterium]
MAHKYKIFFIMPFDTEFNDMYEHIKEVIEEENSIYEVFRADNLLNQQNILKDIVLAINDSDLIVADLTDLNPNVFYELGLAHALRKDVILLTQQLGELPFDLRSYRVISYSNHFKKIQELETNLKRMLNDIQKGQLSFGSPITDWIPLSSSTTEMVVTDNDIQEISSINKTNEIIEEEIEEGYLDFLANLEESMGDLTITINSITEATNKFSEDINEQTAQINKANENGGNGSVSRVRKIARKTSSIMNEYSVLLASKNKAYSLNWNKFEENVTNLFNTDILLKEIEQDDTSFRGFLNELDGFKDFVYPTKDVIESMMNGLRGLRGMEGSITRSTMLIERELREFVDLLDKTAATTDRLYLKGIDLLKIKLS